jgi:hypothetical protein
MQFRSHSVIVVEQVGNPLARAQLFVQASANVIADVPVAPPVEGAPPVEIAPPLVAEPPATGAPAAALVPPVPKVPPAAVVPPVAEAPPTSEAPPAAVVPPVAEAPPVVPSAPPVDLAPVLRPLLLQDHTQEATPNTRTSDPTLFFDMRSLTETDHTFKCPIIPELSTSLYPRENKRDSNGLRASGTEALVRSVLTDADLRLGASASSQNFDHVWAADPSRPAALLLGYIRRVCALVAPCRPGASSTET